MKSYVAKEFKDTGVYQDAGPDQKENGALVTGAIIFGYNENSGDVGTRQITKAENKIALKESFAANKDLRNGASETKDSYVGKCRQDTFRMV